MDNYGKMLCKMDRRVEKAIKKAGHAVCYVDYSAYDTKNDSPVDNLDEVAIKGKAKFRRLADDGWAEVPYESPIVENPTWLELCVLANVMIATSGDDHHVFLEGFDVVGTEGDVQICEFSMGS